jgi:hypothetical protein
MGGCPDHPRSSRGRASGHDGYVCIACCFDAHFRDLAARFTRVLQERAALSNQRAWGMPDARWHPQPRVRGGSEGMHTSIHSEVTGITRHSPRSGLRLMTCSPTILIATVADRVASTDLTPTSDVRTTRLCHTLQAPSLKAPSTATAARPALVTLRNAPLSGMG